MGIRNYLIEGVSGTGKTSVCREFQRRGYHAINGDNELAYQGDPKTGRPLDGFVHEHHIWDIDKVRAMVADHSHAATFFCGGSRNFSSFIHMFDGVFVLDIDADTLTKRLATRSGTEWGANPAERDLVKRLHATKEDIPGSEIIIDATQPLEHVVDTIVEKCKVE